MSKKYQKPVMLSVDAHGKLKQLADESGVPMGSIVESLINYVGKRVESAKERGEIPSEFPDVINPLQEQGKTKVYPDWRLFMALYLREVGLISEEDFQKHKDQLPFMIFMRGLEVIE